MFPITNTFVSRDHNINGKSIIVRKLSVYNARKKGIQVTIIKVYFAAKNCSVSIINGNEMTGIKY